MNPAGGVANVVESRFFTIPLEEEDVGISQDIVPGRVEKLHGDETVLGEADVNRQRDQCWRDEVPCELRRHGDSAGVGNDSNCIVAAS
jgi:hypothetical protein